MSLQLVVLGNSLYHCILYHFYRALDGSHPTASLKVPRIHLGLSFINVHIFLDPQLVHISQSKSSLHLVGFTHIRPLLHVQSSLLA